MRRLAGAALILGGSLWGRWRQLRDERIRRQTLEELLGALRQMAEEIRMARTPLTDLTAMLGRSRSGETALFFQKVSGALRRGASAQQAWRDALQILPLYRRQQELLGELGGELRGDEENICKVITLFISRMERELEEYDRTALERRRRDTGLWLSGAALAVILLL